MDINKARQVAEQASAWHQWVSGYITHAQGLQQQYEQTLGGLSVPTGPQIPGVSYGAQTKKKMRVFLMGTLGTWKTAWCCQWPKPLFISIQSEGGDDTLEKYPELAIKMLTRSQERGILDPPPVFNVARPPSIEIKKAGEVSRFIDQLVLNYKQWGIATVVIDSMTFLIQNWIANHTRERRGSQRKQLETGSVEMMRVSDWGMLAAWVNDWWVKLTETDLNIIVTALDKEKTEQDDRNMAKQNVVAVEAMIQGATRKMLMAATKLVIHAEKKLEMSRTAMGRSNAHPIFWTTPNPLCADIRHKYADAFSANGRLDDPVFGEEPTFRAFWNELGPYIYLGV